ncbi:fungal-specific transcription factor domain-containing protein [Aspergillus navahoensis]
MTPKTPSTTQKRPPRQRRYKAAIACTICRRRKLKCDGVRPACGRCQKKPETRSICAYLPTSSDTNHEDVQPLAAMHPPAAGAAPLLGACSAQPALLEQVDVHSNADPSGFAAKIKSTVFAQLGLPAPRRKCACPIPLANAPIFGDLSLPGPANGTLDNTDNVLPPRKHADYLVSLYWQTIEPQEPLLDSNRFSRAYQFLFAGSNLDCDEGVFTSMLNLVFALATQLQESVPIEQRDRASKTFFLRAWRLLRPEAILWQDGSLELVQCLLLMARYLQCTRNVHQTWMALGSALRIAQALGLHSLSSDAEGDDAQLRRQTWLHCLFMERHLSYLLGRPSMVLVTSLSSIDSHSRAVSTDLLAEMHELGRIQGYIMFLQTPAHLTDSLGPLPRPRTDSSSITVKIDDCLNKLENSLQPSLDNNVNSRLHFLRLRITHTRTLLYRPMLAQLCLARLPNEFTYPATHNMSLDDSITQTCATLCIESVNKIITLLQNSGTISTRALIPWWHRVFYLYITMQHLIAAMLRPDIFGDTVPCLWDRSIALLAAHEHLSVSVRRCLASFQGMWQKVIDIQAFSRAYSSTQNQGVPDLEDAQFWDVFHHLGFDLGTLEFGVGGGIE